MDYNFCYACKVSIKNKSSCMEINLCNDCQNDEYVLINKTNAKKKFCLNDNDIINLPKNKIVNKYGRITTLYYYDDIINKAHKKYGGVSGLINAQEKRLKLSKNLKDINKLKIEDKYNMINCRRNLLFSELEKHNLNYYENINEFYNYIDMGDESGYTFEDIIKIFIEYNFLYKKTNYSILLNKYKCSNIDIKKNIKMQSIKDYIQNNSINDIPIDLLKKYKINCKI